MSFAKPAPWHGFRSNILEQPNRLTRRARDLRRSKMSTVSKVVAAVFALALSAQGFAAPVAAVADSSETGSATGSVSKSASLGLGAVNTERAVAIGVGIAAIVAAFIVAANDNGSSTTAATSTSSTSSTAAP
jgi:hypothetical protein